MGRRGKVTLGTVASAEDAAHVLIFNPWITLLGQSAYAAVTALIYILYKPLVAPEIMQIWIMVTFTIGVCVVCIDFAFAIRRPRQQELLRIWRPIDKRVTMLFDSIAALSIWLLFPKGGPELQMVSVAFCVGYVPLQMISDPENTFGNRFSIVAVLGSYSTWLFWNGETTQQVLAVLFVLYGIVLFIAADAFRSVVVSAIARQRESEQAAKELRAAAQQVALERDAKTRFIASASHDLGQPLQAANLFVGQLVGADNQEQRFLVTDGLARAIASAQQLLGDMLNYLRLEADAVAPNFSAVDLGSTLPRLTSQFKPLASQQKTVIRLVPSSLSIWADSSLFDRALGNLLANALVHSGGKRVLVGARRYGNGLITIWVIDDGGGVDEPDQEFIFDDYYQGKNTQRNVHRGFGLGLPSVGRIASLLGGGAGLDLRWTNGSAFYLRVPMTEGK